MTITNRMPTGTLQQQIQAFQTQLATQVPPEILAAFVRSTADLVQTGIARKSVQPGEGAPDFTLPDVFGKQVTLSDQLKQGPVVLTFYRGAWCPYCDLQLRAYQKILPRIQEAGASLIAISPQLPDHSLSTVEKKELTFAVLSDVGNRVAQAYGLVFTLEEAMRGIYSAIGSDLPTFNGDTSWDLPMPGTFIIGQDQTIHLAFVDEDFTHRLEPAALLDGLPVLGQKSL